MLHEGLGCVDMWGAFPAAVCRRTGCAVLAYSRRGYGRSDPLAGPYERDFMHREAREVLPALLEATGVEAVVLLGHSDGGSISLVYAGSPDTGGARIHALVLLAAHAFNEPVCMAGIRDADRAFRSTSLRGALARYHGERVDEVFGAWRDIWLHPSFEDWSIEDCLPAITCPVLVVQGRNDPYGTLDQVHAITEGVGGQAYACILDACGHAPHRDQRACVEEEIERFVLALRSS